MNITRTLLLIVTFYLYSCSTPDANKKHELEGEILNHKFSNKYFTLNTENWVSDTASINDFVFLNLRKGNSGDASIAFGGGERGIYDKLGFASIQDVQREIIKSNTLDTAYQLVYKDKKLNISGMDFLSMKHRYVGPAKSLQVVYYMAEVRDYYLVIIFTADERRPPTDATRVIESMKFF